MTLYERFGWVIKPETYLENLDYARLDPPRLDSIPDRKGDRVACASNVAICFYLLNQKKKAARYARETVDATIEYFFGKWKEKVPTDLGNPDPEWWRVHDLWIPTFREGLYWASALGDWAKATKIAQYPTPKSYGFPKEDKALYLLLAMVVRGGDPKEFQSVSDQISRGKKEKPKLILRVLQGIEQKNQGDFQRSLEEYLCYFRKREFRTKELNKLLATDGTILLHLGAREGLEFHAPPEVSDQLIRL
jgi:hypothetical protein